MVDLVVQTGLLPNQPVRSVLPNYNEQTQYTDKKQRKIPCNQEGRLER